MRAPDCLGRHPCLSLLKFKFANVQFLIKITPLNPTYSAFANNLVSYIDPYHPEKDYRLVEDLREAGYQTIVSIGAVEENYIGSNCGQYVRRHLEAAQPLEQGYTYPIEGYS